METKIEINKTESGVKIRRSTKDTEGTIYFSDEEMDEIFTAYYDYSAELYEIEYCEMCGKELHTEDDLRECDMYVPFGGYEEPLPPKYICPECIPDFDKDWDENFENKTPCWQKSNAELKAAKKRNLAWVSEGVGTLGSNVNWARGHQYIDKDEYIRLKALPYWGYCEICGAVRHRGHCTNKHCEKSFNYGKENK